jgi:hypothetical protein
MDGHLNTLNYTAWLHCIKKFHVFNYNSPDWNVWSFTSILSTHHTPTDHVQFNLYILPSAIQI